MSQVVVTDDMLKSKRDLSKVQEQRISTDGPRTRFALNPLPKNDVVAKALGVIALPIAFAWSGLTAITYAIFQVISYVFRGIGKLLK